MKMKRVSSFILVLLVTFYSTNAYASGSPYLSYGSPEGIIDVYQYGAGSTWNTAMTQARTNWHNATSKILFYTSANSNNTIQALALDATYYGVMIPLSVSGSTLNTFRIRLNSTTIINDAASGYLGNFIQSVLVHELGHTIWLADNPPTSSSSIMSYSRNRNTMTSPSSYDIANVNAKY